MQIMIFAVAIVPVLETQPIRVRVIVLDVIWIAVVSEINALEPVVTECRAIEAESWHFHCFTCRLTHRVQESMT